MISHHSNLIAILAMGVVALGCRLGGYWLFTRINLSPPMQTFLSYIPGALFVSYVVPAIATGGPKEWIGAVVALGVALLGKSLTWTVVLGTGATWVAWLYL